MPNVLVPMVFSVHGIICYPICQCICSIIITITTKDITTTTTAARATITIKTTTTTTEVVATKAREGTGTIKIDITTVFEMGVLQVESTLEDFLERYHVTKEEVVEGVDPTNKASANLRPFEAMAVVVDPSDRINVCCEHGGD